MYSLEGLLYSGGDERLYFNKNTNFNKYMCTMTPNDAVEFGASTASTISPFGYQAVGILKAKIEQDLQKLGHQKAYDRCLAQQISKLRNLCGLEYEIEVDLHPSGSDCFRSIIDMLVSRISRPVSVVIVAPSETGSGVYAAISRVAQTGGKVVPIEARQADGCAISSKIVSANFEAAAAEIVESGGQVLLVVTDISKTGLLVPELDVAQYIEQRWPGNIALLVDACQMRLSPETLGAYLKRGWPTIITGSKFWGGAPFSGAVLTPRGSICAELMGNDKQLSKPAANFGTLLRWEAALAEASRFLSLPAEEVRRFIEKFGDAIRSETTIRPAIMDVDVPALSRSAMAVNSVWDGLQTIFPIGLSSHGRRLSCKELSAIYQSLAYDGGLELPGSHRATRFHLGQPVYLGQKDLEAWWGLRFSVSARMVTSALAAPSAQGQIFDQLTRAFDRLVWIVENPDSAILPPDGA